MILFLLLALSSLGVSDKNIDDNLSSHSVGIKVWSDSSLEIKDWNVNSATASTIIGGPGRVWEKICVKESFIVKGYAYIPEKTYDLPKGISYEVDHFWGNEKDLHTVNRNATILH